MRCNKLKMTGVLILGVGMSGCAVSEAVKGWDNRYGPDPAMPLAKVQESIKNQNGIMAELENQVQGKDGSINYMNVTLAGFNFVDEQCDAYLKELFAKKIFPFRRRIQRIDYDKFRLPPPIQLEKHI